MLCNVREARFCGHSIFCGILLSQVFFSQSWTWVLLNHSWLPGFFRVIQKEMRIRHSSYSRSAGKGWLDLDPSPDLDMPWEKGIWGSIFCNKRFCVSPQQKWKRLACPQREQLEKPAKMPRRVSVADQWRQIVANTDVFFRPTLRSFRQCVRKVLLDATAVALFCLGQIEWQLAGPKSESNTSMKSVLNKLRIEYLRQGGHESSPRRVQTGPRPCG